MEWFTDPNQKCRNYGDVYPLLKTYGFLITPRFPPHSIDDEARMEAYALVYLSREEC